MGGKWPVHLTSLRAILIRNQTQWGMHWATLPGYCQNPRQWVPTTRKVRQALPGTPQPPCRKKTKAVSVSKTLGPSNGVPLGWAAPWENPHQMEVEGERGMGVGHMHPHQAFHQEQITAW